MSPNISKLYFCKFNIISKLQTLNVENRERSFKIKTLIISTLLILLCVVDTYAQSTDKYEYYVNGGITFPIRPDTFSDYWDNGFNFGVGVGKFVQINLINLNMTLTDYIHFQYNSFRFDRDKFLQDFGLNGYGVLITGSNASIITALWGLKATPHTNQSCLHPYFCGGVGIFKKSISDFTVSWFGQSKTVEGSSDITGSFISV